MSAHAEHSRAAARIVLPSVDVFLTAGWGPLVVVALSGLSLGFFFWDQGVIPTHRPTLIQAGLLFLPPLCALASVGLWLWYGRYFSLRTGVRYQRSLEYDALAWLPFIGLWLTFMIPISVSHGSSRLLLYCFAVFCAVKLAVAVRFNMTVREVTIDFIVTRFAIIVIAELAAVIIGQRPGVHVQESRNLLLNVWGRWDAVHYIDIATVGYHGTDMAFFPLYPLLIAALGVSIGNHLIAGLVISNVAFFFGLLFLYKLLEHEYSRDVARRAIFYVSIFPTSLYFSAVYPESLFFMLSVASFYYMRGRRWWMAGIIGFFAAMTRVEGVLLTVPFAIEWVTAHWNTFKEMLHPRGTECVR